ncbi:MAG: hypothetical protein ACYC0V_06475 [Armatimonadota bacterium]
MEDSNRPSFMEKFYKIKNTISIISIYIVMILYFFKSVHSKDWINAYGIASPAIAYIVACLINRFFVYRNSTGNDEVETVETKKGLSIISLLISVPIVGIVGFILFKSEMLNHVITRYLAIISGIAAICLIIYQLPFFVRLRRPKVCVNCGLLSHYSIVNQDESDTQYCRTHFLEQIRAGFNTYDGKFLIVESNKYEKSNEAEYYFYEPGILLDESYSESDVENLNKIIAFLLPSNKESQVIAVLIPNNSVKYPDNFDEEPLRLPDPHHIKVRQLDKAALISHIEQVTANYNHPDCKFKMNLPHGTTGIYFWYDYTW